MSYTDAIAIFSYAPHCSDIAHQILAEKELESAAQRLAKAAARREARALWTSVRGGK